MPFRMLLDSGTVHPADAVLVGARNLDPPEVEFIAASGLLTGIDDVDGALEGVDAVYVAFDADVLDPDDDVVVLHAGARGPHGCRGGSPAPPDRGRATGGRHRRDRARAVAQALRRSPGWQSRSGS